MRTHADTANAGLFSDASDTDFDIGAKEKVRCTLVAIGIGVISKRKMCKHASPVSRDGVCAVGRIDQVHGNVRFC